LRIGDKAFEIVQQRLNALRRQVIRYASHARCWAGGVFGQRIGYATFITEIIGAVCKQPRIRVRARAGREKVLDRLREQRILGAIGNCGIAINRQHGQ